MPHRDELPHSVRHALATHLAPDERMLAVFCTDLDAERRFGVEYVVLTNHALLSQHARFSGKAGLEHSWRNIPLTDIASLTATGRSGLGTLEVRSASARLAHWHYTLARASSARNLVECFAEARHGRVDHRADPRLNATVKPVQREPPRVSTLSRLLRFARPHAPALGLGLLLMLGTTAAGLVPPYLTWPLVDEVLSPYQNEVEALRRRYTHPHDQTRALDRARIRGKRSFVRVPWILAGMLSAALAAWALAWAHGWVLARVSERISADLRNTTYAHVQKLSLDFFGSKRTGDLIARISSDTDRICFFLSDTLIDFITDMMMILGTAVMLFSMDPLLAVATLGTFPFVAWMTLSLRNWLTQGFLRGRRAWAEMTNLLTDTIPGVRVVKAFAQEQREIERFRQANAQIVAANDRVNRLWTFFWPMVALLNQLGLLVAWGFGAWRVLDQRVTVGVLTAFLAYIVRFYARLESMTRMAGNTQRAAASAQRIFELLDQVPSVPEPAHPIPLGKLAGSISLRHVSFRFGDRWVIDDVSLDIAAGEMVGLVGPTGSGKSTLLNLVCRFYDVSEGEILVDGTDIRSFSLEAYRRHIGIVLQDPFLFYGTIAANIAYGCPGASRSEIVAAARAARAHEFILQLPEGYDSMVGERGQTLSGGERQRISIARALLIDPRILILDEATSSVDTHTERQIQEALDNLVRGRTTIAIAHRLGTLRNASRLVVLDKGQIAEIGDHQTLLMAGGLYARLVREQSHTEPPLAPELSTYGSASQPDRSSDGHRVTL